MKIRKKTSALPVEYSEGEDRIMVTVGSATHPDGSTKVSSSLPQSMPAVERLKRLERNCQVAERTVDLFVRLINMGVSIEDARGLIRQWLRMARDLGPEKCREAADPRDYYPQQLLSVLDK